MAELSSDHVAHKAKNTDYLVWKKFDDSLTKRTHSSYTWGNEVPHMLKGLAQSYLAIHISSYAWIPRILISFASVFSRMGIEGGGLVCNKDNLLHGLVEKIIWNNIYSWGKHTHLRVPTETWESWELFLSSFDKEAVCISVLLCLWMKLGGLNRNLSLWIHLPNSW